MSTPAQAVEMPSFDEALDILGIEEFRGRIFNSNSHGELLHLFEYQSMAAWIKSLPKEDKWGMLVVFKARFKQAVKFAEENWQRPESVFQHLNHLFL